MDLKTIVTVLFKDKSQWKDLTNKDKSDFMFIVNRFLAKKYPRQSQYFNVKNIDKVSSMDVWFSFLKDQKNIPFWFWKGPTKRKDPPIKDWNVLLEFYEIDINDIYLLCDLYPEDVKSEIKRIQAINKEINE